MSTDHTIKVTAFTAILACMMVLNLSPAGKKDPWKEWLKEVEPITTHTERSVAKLLKTEEERSRFRELFWKARDPNPQTPENEYQVEYYRRMKYAGKFLKGINSDRGRIYMLLGEPKSKSSFVGYNSLAESELWSYEGVDRPGLPPFMSLVFFRPRNTGDFQLYYPGMHDPVDLLSPQYANNIKTPLAAYREIKQTSGELAAASLSIIPSEGDPQFGMSLGTSNLTLNRIFSLPEEEAEVGYIKNFKIPGGYVQVTHTTNEIRGFCYMTITRNQGIPFVHYAVMPDKLNFKQPSRDLFTADIQLNISIEDTRGNILYQNQKNIDLKFDPARKQKIDDQRMVFRDFCPVIEGDCEIMISFFNKTTQEFFTQQQRVSVAADGNNTVPMVRGAVGFKLEEIRTGNYIPFAADQYLVSTDPRFTFSQKDSLAGIVWVPGSPAVYLESLGAEKGVIRIQPQPESLSQPVPLPHPEPQLQASVNTPANISIYTFRQPLAGVKDGNYRLMVKTPAGRTVTLVEKIHILPFYIEVKRPFAIEKAEPERSRDNYIFIRGQQYLNAGRPEQAIASFNQIPQNLWNVEALPIIANAFYKKKDYAKVLELLEREGVKKEYPALLMLANSSIELKLYPRALEYLEKIREYGDTPEINNLLASTYLIMGDRDKAVKYYEQARKLKNKTQEQEKEDGNVKQGMNYQEDNKESNHE